MGYLFKLFSSPINWKLIKGRTVTKSSTEAELLALSATGTELYWWIRFFKNIALDLDQEYRVGCDNIQTIRLIEHNSTKLSTKLRHVDIHQH